MRLRFAAAGLAAALIAPLSVASASPAAAAGELDIVQLNVGQGDAALFRAPCGEVALIDAGDGAADDVDDQIAAWGGASIEWVAATHYDSDHLGDISQVADGHNAQAVFDRGGGSAAKDTQTYADYYAWAQTFGESHIGLEIGDQLLLCPDAVGEEVTFTVISVGTDGTAAGERPVSDENDMGLCFLVEFGDFDMATCGDLNGTDDGSRADVETYVAEDLGDVEVAKVNHHGSAYSSNRYFIYLLDAEVALISAGSNSYGHPAPEVVDRWEGFGASVFVTGVDAAGLTASGDVTVSTDGRTGFAVQTERSDAVFTSELDEGVSAEPEPQPQPTEPDPEPEPTEPEPTPEPEPTGPLPPGTAASRGIDDSCPDGQFPEDGFVDVLAGNTHETAIDCLVWWRVANGRNSAYYAPAAGVARDAMASFIARAVGLDLSQPVPDAFLDDNQSTHQQAINHLAQAGIVGGTGGGNYSPTRIVTRGQMARFLSNAAAYVLGAQLPETQDFFDDDNGHLFEHDINRVAQAGIAGGRGGRFYDVASTVSRDQMASFLARLIDLLVENGVRQSPAPETQPRNPGDSVNCEDFRSEGEAQAYYNHYFPQYGDVAGLDADSDGTACEVDAPPPPPPAPAPEPAPEPYYANCSEARAAGAAPLYRGEPGYRSGLDRDNDGVACE